MFFGGCFGVVGEAVDFVIVLADEIEFDVMFATFFLGGGNPGGEGVLPGELQQDEHVDREVVLGEDGDSIGRDLDEPNAMRG